jgi:cell division protein FtsI/penicillin-binding protein 2
MAASGDASAATSTPVAASAAPAASPAVAGGAASTPAAPRAPATLRLQERGLDAGGDRYVAPLGDGRAVLTLVPRVQQQVEKVLADARVPWGAVVLLDPRSGRVLAMAEHSQREPDARGLCLQARAPAASIFKIVTSAALLHRGFDPSAEVCYHGGQHRVRQVNLADDPRRDRRCLSLSSALGHSANVVFAKLADRALNAELLRSEAERFLFNRPIPFPQPVEPSRAEIPDDPLGLATTAAGFGPVRLSALHGAVLASIVANGGVFVPPEVVSSATGAEPPPATEPRRVLDERVAGALAGMMRTTVTEGTARRVFHDRRTRASSIAQLTVAGKTGSLSEADPFRDYSWFVGFAPVDRPQVAFAVMVVNDRAWRVKASSVARDALRAWSDWDAGRMQASVVPASRGRRSR